jgi:hypothetical protein
MLRMPPLLSSRVPRMIVLGGEDASGQMVGQVMNSADGLSWSDVSPPTPSAAQRRNVAFVSDGYQVSCGRLPSRFFPDSILC